jgi:hypothetical protein
MNCACWAIAGLIAKATIEQAAQRISVRTMHSRFYFELTSNGL